jgi:hypothetical protein
MIKRLVLTMFALVAFGSLAWCTQSSTGTLSDDKCDATKHDTACIEKCVAAGAKYVLVSKGKVYSLDAQDKLRGMGGKRVKITGTLSGTDAITVASVTPR